MTLAHLLDQAQLVLCHHLGEQQAQEYGYRWRPPVDAATLGVALLQSRASVAADVPALAQGKFERSGLGLFIEVESLDAVLPKLEGVEIVVPERKTFYGAREVFVRAPCGTVVGFAEMTNDA